MLAKHINNKKRMAYSHPFFVLCLCCISLLSHAQDTLPWSKVHISAYHHILDLQFEQAEATLKHSNNPHAYYLKSFSSAIHLALDENPEHYKPTQASIETNISLIEDSQLPTHIKNYYLADCYLFLSFIEVIFEDKFSAYWDFRRAYKSTLKNIEDFPEFAPNYKTAGLLNAIIGSIPEEYQWIPNTLGYHGSLHEAQIAFEKVIQQDSLIGKEATLLEALAMGLLAKDFKVADNALANLSGSREKLSAELFVSGILDIRNHKPREGIIKLGSIDSSVKTKLPFIYYLIGEAQLSLLNYPESTRYINLYIKGHKGKNHIKSSYYKLYCAYFLQEKHELALLAFNNINKYGQTLYDTDKYAQSEFDKNTPPQATLLKARLLCDGGSYTLALKELNRLNTAKVSKQHLIEYHYRKGRILQNTHQEKKAISAFKNVLKISQPSPLPYFVPNSCLQLGLIYKTENQRDSSLFYLKKTLEYKNYPYRKSISTKSKHAIEELKN